MLNQNKKLIGWILICADEINRDRSWMVCPSYLFKEIIYNLFFVAISRIENSEEYQWRN